MLIIPRMTIVNYPPYNYKHNSKIMQAKLIGGRTFSLLRNKKVPGCQYVEFQPLNENTHVLLYRDIFLELDRKHT